jgi:lipoprotein-anchoring transpeptidase ErfK/SrfK
VIKTFPVLTAVNPDVNVNNRGVAYLENHPESKGTPRGTYTMNPDKNIYGQPGFHLQPVPAFGEPAPKAKDIATHVTYPGEFEERNPLYAQKSENRYASYGCVNCRKPDINYLTDRFKKGDTTMVIDSKIKRDANFLAKKLFSRK